MAKKILIIEDNVLTIDEIEFHLKELGYANIESAVSGQEAITKARSFQPDLILSDINLGSGMDGIQAIEEIAKFLAVPVIYLTAYDDPETVQRARVSGPYAYMVKPLQKKELGIAIDIAFYKNNMEKRLQEANEKLQERVEEEVARVRDQEQLLVTQSRLAALGEMIGAIAHQWKQPLHGLNLSIADLEDAYSYGELGEEYMKEFTKSAVAQIQFMSQTIDDFRNFFKPSREKRFIDIAAAVRQTLDLFQPQIKKDGIQVDVVVSSYEGWKACGYENEFKQVILNILSNARDAIEENKKKTGQDYEGRINIRIFTRDEWGCIEFSDNGGGIPENLIESIFHAYVSSKGDNGTGVGLNISRTIVEKNMKGEVRVANGEQGAIFTILLPQVRLSAEQGMDCNA